MWNYSFVVPSALMMMTLFGFYFSRPRLPLRMNSTFLGLIVIELAVLASDIISTKADEAYESFSAGTLYAVNILFFMLFLLRILWFYRFMIQMLHLDTRRHPVLVATSIAPFAVAELLCITSAATGAVFSIQETGYVSGPLYPVVTATYLVYIAVSFGLLFAYGKNLRRHDRTTGFFYNIALLIGSITRIVLPKLLVMDTFCMVAIAIIYLGILNPDLYLSENGKSFNMRGLRMILSDPSQKSTYGLLGFVLHNYSHERSILGGQQMDGVVSRISEHLTDAYSDKLLFYLRDGRFAILGDSTADWGAAEREIKEYLEGPYLGEDYELHLPVTFVYADATLELHTADRIINNLTIALDSCKRSTTIESLDVQSGVLSTKQVEQQVEILYALERAVYDNTAEVYYQPMIDVITRKIVGVEALARIRDSEGQIISPGLFIPIAESSGLINQLGEQVLRKTCEFACANNLDSMGVQWININLSPIQFLQKNLAGQINEILATYGVPADTIRLEITEQSMLDYSLLQNQILELDSCGFKLVMDDYGSGYSNLTRVKRYPFVTIKLDMAIVWDYFRDRDTLLPTIVHGFKQMGMSITAEGIESEEMAQALADIGADFLQGFYFSKPLPPNELVAKYSGTS